MPLTRSWYVQLFGENSSDTSAATGIPIESSMAVRFQQKSFYSNGRYWIFYTDGTTFGFAKCYFSSSTDGVTWETPTPFSGFINEHTGENLVAFLDGNGKVNVFFRVSTRLEYCFGTANSDGSISWITANQTTLEINAAQNYDLDATIDSTGHLWVSWIYSASGGPYMRVIAARNALTNGTWQTDYTIDVDDGSTNQMMIPLSGGRIYFIYFHTSQSYIYGKVWNGASFGPEEQISSNMPIVDYSPGYESYARSTVVDGFGNLYFLYVTQSNNLVSVTRSSSGTWGSSQLVQSSVPDYASPSMSIGNGVISAFWLNNQTSIFSKRMFANTWESSVTLKIPLTDCQINSAYDYGYNGHLNAFSKVLNGSIALFYCVNETSSNDLFIRMSLVETSNQPFITVTSNNGGSISPSDSVLAVYPNTNQTFTITHDATHTIHSVVVNGTSHTISTGTDSFDAVFTNVSSNSTLVVTFDSKPSSSGGGDDTPTPTPTPFENPDYTGGDGDVLFKANDLNLGNCKANSIVIKTLTIAFSGSSYTMTANDIVLDDPFNTWLKNIQIGAFILQADSAFSTAQISLTFQIPANVSGNFEGTIKVRGLDAFGTTHTSTSSIHASVDVRFNPVIWVQDNPLIVVGAVVATVALLVGITFFSKRRR